MAIPYEEILLFPPQIHVSIKTWTVICGPRIFLDYDGCGQNETQSQSLINKFCRELFQQRFVIFPLFGIQISEIFIISINEYSGRKYVA